MAGRLRVGIIGCGAAAQAIHLPTLSALSDLLTVTVCADPDAGVAEAVARRTGARAETDVDALITSPDVDVVAVCSPEQFHADHVVAACEAGKRAVLCEKPLAHDAGAAERIVAAAERTGVPVVAATMHRYDEALRWLSERWEDLPGRATVVRSTTYIPPNDLLVRSVTEVATPGPTTAPTRPGAPAEPAPPPEMVLFRGLATGLLVHHLPLVRMAFGRPSDLEVDIAVPLGTSGYEISLRTGDRRAELGAVLYAFPRTEWTFEVVAESAQARLDYPPGFRTDTSARASWWSAEGSGVRCESALFAEGSGYRAEWRRVAAVAHGGTDWYPALCGARDDVVLAERISATAAERFGVRR